MLGVYNYTVILTYAGMLISFAGMLFALDMNIHSALLCLMMSGVCDMFDGKIAATMERTAKEKRFGIQIDSLSDLVCFGVLPAVIICRTSSGGFMCMAAAGLYLLCALIRLAWFNVDEEERQAETQCARETYLGLPVTTAALFVPAIIGLARLLGWPVNIVGPSLLLIMSAAFVTPFPLKKPALTGKIVLLCSGFMVLLILLLGAKL